MFEVETENHQYIILAIKSPIMKVTSNEIVIITLIVMKQTICYVQILFNCIISVDILINYIIIQKH